MQMVALTRAGWGAYWSRLLSLVVAEMACKPAVSGSKSRQQCFDHKKRKRLENMVWYMIVWGKGVPQWAHAEASLPPRDQTHTHTSIV